MSSFTRGEYIKGFCFDSSKLRASILNFVSSAIPFWSLYPQLYTKRPSFLSLRTVGQRRPRPELQQLSVPQAFPLRHVYQQEKGCKPAEGTRWMLRPAQQVRNTLLSRALNAGADRGEARCGAGRSPPRHPGRGADVSPVGRNPWWRLAACHGRRHPSAALPGPGPPRGGLRLGGTAAGRRRAASTCRTAARWRVASSTWRRPGGPAPPAARRYRGPATRQKAKCSHTRRQPLQRGGCAATGRPKTASRPLSPTASGRLSARGRPPPPPREGWAEAAGGGAARRSHRGDSSRGGGGARGW